MNRSVEQLAEVTLGAWQAVADAAARQQEQASRLALGWTERSMEMLRGQAEAHHRLVKTLTAQSEKQAEALWALTRESTEVWMDLLFAPLPSSRQEMEVTEGTFRPKEGREDGRRVPIENYDRLSIEEISRRLENLRSDEITELKAYEEQHKNRASLLERFNRALA